MLSKKRSIPELLQEWQYDEELKQNIKGWHTLEEKRQTMPHFRNNFIRPSLKH